MSNIKLRESTRTLVLGAILTGLVFLLQLLGSFIKLGPFAISLVLVPIVIGAATCGWKISTWLGFIFGVAVLVSGDAAAFLVINIPGTIATVLLKGTACGLVAGFIYKLVAKKERYVAVATAAVVCPIINTAVFLLGCVVFFLPDLQLEGIKKGYDNVASYILLGLVGGNFIVELVLNIVLSPIIVRLLNIRKKT